MNRADFTQLHHDIYRLVVNGATYKPTCFQIESGPEELGHDQISHALVGFEIDEEPFGTLALDADDDSGQMRVPLSATKTGSPSTEGSALTITHESSSPAA